MKKQLIFIFFVSLSQVAFAQFNGGKGDGVDKSSIVQTNLNGTIGSITPLYQGGAGDGSDQNMISAWLNGTNINMLYSGGRGDGFVSSAASFTLSGDNLTSLYSGGGGDGFDKKSFSGILNGTSIDIIYGGGVGDGVDHAQFQSFLSGLTSDILYTGGSGDGFDKKAFSGILNGTSIEIVFGGGSGDGVDHAQIQAFLSGISTAVLYSGGDGDGFAMADFRGAMVLPIELLSFDATAKENYVLVKWLTASEQDTDYFTVERSQNGMLFNKLTVVPGQGISNTVQTYTVNDHDPLRGRSYYRLKWTDVDGKSEYSDIRSVLFDKNNSKDFLLFPNPNEGNDVYVQLDGMTQNEKVSVSLTTVQGKIIYQSQNPSLNGNRIKIPLQQRLTKGSYVVQVVRNGESSSKVLIVR